MHVRGGRLGVLFVAIQNVGGAAVGVRHVADGQVEVDNVAELAKDFVEVVGVDVCREFFDDDLGVG